MDRRETEVGKEGVRQKKEEYVRDRACVREDKDGTKESATAKCEREEETHEEDREHILFSLMSLQGILPQWRTVYVHVCVCVYVCLCVCVCVCWGELGVK